MPLRSLLWLCCSWLVLSCCEPAEKTVVEIPVSSTPAETIDLPEETEIVNPAHFDTARSYIGTVDRGDNTGRDVDRFLASVGIDTPAPWCAAYASYCLSVNDIEFPTERSALASDFITRRSMKASHVLLGREQPQKGDLVIWRRGNGIFGHIGFVSEWRGECGQTVEGNTSPPDGLEYDGVWGKDRCIQPGNYFRIVSFTPVNP